MNKIEELHVKSRNELIEKSDGDYIYEAEFGKAHAAITEEIAIKFALWTEDNMYCRLGVDELWHKIPEQTNYTTSELFAEFIKTL